MRLQASNTSGLVLSARTQAVPRARRQGKGNAMSAKTRFVACSATLIAVSIFSSGALAADLTCSSPTLIDTPATFDNVSVENGCVLTVNALLTVNANMTIRSGGVVTHTAGL